jgi:hypothetical protein
MEHGDLNNYLKAVRSTKDKVGNKNITPVFSERKQAFVKQRGKCLKCNHELKPLYSKYLKNPETKKMEVLCSDCAIKISKKKN